MHRPDTDLSAEECACNALSEGVRGGDHQQCPNLLSALRSGIADVNKVGSDMARGLSDADREFYEDTLNIRESANLMRLDRESWGTEARTAC